MRIGNSNSVVMRRRKPIRFIVARILMRTGLCRFLLLKQKNYVLRFFPTPFSRELWIDKEYQHTANIFFSDYLKFGDAVIDIGANIGLYSIYAALKHPNIEVVCFEPSSSNLRVLSRNISINKLENIIKINQFPLTNKENQYLLMKENDFIEGGALNSFGESFDFEGKNFKSNNNYQIYGTTINYLLKNKILSIPNHIKIDVDGIEHLILAGANDYLSNIEIQSLSIEINENFKEQYCQVLDILSKSNFKIKHKKNAEMLNDANEFSKTFNYVFEKHQ